MKKLLKSIGISYLFFFATIMLLLIGNIPVFLADYTGIEEFRYLIFVHVPVLFGIIIHYSFKP